MKHYHVVVPPAANESLRDIIAHIKKESPVAAVKVREELIRVAKSLNESPQRFSREEWLKGWRLPLSSSVAR